ncbi:MAG TPA: hypothetical protein VHZ99_14365, partial [Steroidobacteraceae bacterium]|nr:hypothetical protein [Steroidobacteraceae bacterium]
MRAVHAWMLIVPGGLILAAMLEALWLQRRDGYYDWKAWLTSLGDLVLRAAVRLLPLGMAAGA